MIMPDTSNSKVAVVVPSWNGLHDLPACIDSLLGQSLKAKIIVVENGSTDGSLEYLQSTYPFLVVLPQAKNLGFDGGVNVGIRYALEEDYEYIALFNNDAVADKDWLKHLVDTLSTNSDYGIAACKFMSIDKQYLDSTGDLYTNWGLSYPRGRDEKTNDAYDQLTDIFGASGGSSLYRSSMLRQIGLFDEDFFAYYEDVDISFRAQLAGWKVVYEPKAIAYHQIGGTSGKIKGFTTYQTIKNQPLVLWKNVPLRFLWRVGWRFSLAHTMFIGKAILRGHGLSALKGVFVGTYLLIKKTPERWRIQKSQTVSDNYIWGIITHDLPPNAHNLRELRAKWWKLIGKKA